MGELFSTCFRLQEETGEPFSGFAVGYSAGAISEAVHCSCWLPRIGATRRKVEVSAQPLYGSSGEITGSVIVMHDITDVKKSQMALAESERLFSVVLNHAPVGLSVIGQDQRFSYVNSALAEMCGYSASEMIGRSLAEFCPSLDGQPDDNTRPGNKAEPGRDNFGFEKLTKSASGQALRLSVNVKRVRNSEGQVLYSVAQVQDVTDERRRLEELHEAKELAHVTVSSASEGIVRTDGEAHITLSNPVAANLLGCSVEEIADRKFSDAFRFLSAFDGLAIEDPVENVLRTGLSQKMNSMLRLKRNNGTSVRVNLSIAPTAGTDGELTGTVVLIQDASEIAQLTDRLVHQANTDELTGLANRRAFEVELEKSVAGTRDGDEIDFLMLLDLDHFKIVNDAYGHAEGDKLLQDLALVLKCQVRENDFVARIGGDEFAIIMRGVDEKTAGAVADRIIAAVGEYRMEHDGTIFKLGVSVGLSSIEGNVEAAAITGQADTACYAAKHLGRGRSFFFRKDDVAILEEQQTVNWFQRIQNGLDKGLFRVFLQEIVDVDRRPVGYEALLRLRENGQTYLPNAFVETARRHNLFPKLDRYVFERVIELLKGRNDGEEIFQSRYISVNLSSASVASPDFRDWMEKALKNNIEFSENLWIELTETDKFRWTDAEAAFLRNVRSAGVRLFLDDFGTGYNSFEFLKKMQFDGLKLDHSVVSSAANSAIDRALVEASKKICGLFDMEIVAEGVETEEQIEYLQHMGIKKFQGFLFHKPEDVSDLFRRVRGVGLPTPVS